MDVFTCNEYKWRSAIGDNVKDWIDFQLEYWLEEQPE